MKIILKRLKLGLRLGWDTREAQPGPTFSEIMRNI